MASIYNLFTFTVRTNSTIVAHLRTVHFKCRFLSHLQSLPFGPRDMPRRGSWTGSPPQIWLDIPSATPIVLKYDWLPLRGSVGATYLPLCKGIWVRIAWKSMLLFILYFKIFNNMYFCNISGTDILTGITGIVILKWLIFRLSLQSGRSWLFQPFIRYFQVCILIFAISCKLVYCQFQTEKPWSLSCA